MMNNSLVVDVSLTPDNNHNSAYDERDRVKERDRDRVKERERESERESERERDSTGLKTRSSRTLHAQVIAYTQ